MYQRVLYDPSATWLDAVSDLVSLFAMAAMTQVVVRYHDEGLTGPLVEVSPVVRCAPIDAIQLALGIKRMCQGCHHFITLGPTGWDHERFASYHCGACN